MRNNSFKEDFVKNINSISGKYRLICSKYGHYYVDPMPTKEDLNEFYKEKYFSDNHDVSSKGMDIGIQDEKERFHFDRQYDEIVQFLNNNVFNVKDKDINILDVGCGTGRFLTYLKSCGYKNLYGTEFVSSPSLNDIQIYNGDFLSFKTDLNFDFVAFNNILEHVIDPVSFLQKAYKLLNKHGFIRVQVPNDLTYTQYKSLLHKEEPNYYFFQPREHLHYFDFDSIEKMLKVNGFKVKKRITNWPMETFILMGIDYSNDKSLGKVCHNYRVNFEYNLGKEFLLKFYEKIADIDLGRVVIVYAKKL